MIYKNMAVDGANLGYGMPKSILVTMISEIING